MLDEEIRVPKGDDNTFLKKISAKFGSKKKKHDYFNVKMKKRNQFAVIHFAGDGLLGGCANHACFEQLVLACGPPDGSEARSRTLTKNIQPVHRRADLEERKRYGNDFQR